MLTFYSQYKSNIYSQNGEDGILAEVIKRIFPENPYGTCVEFGAGDGRTNSNTARLIEQGWTGVMIEADTNLYKECINAWANRKNVMTMAAMVTPENVNMIVPAFTDVLSIDIDGHDYEVWKALKHQPAVVIIEINSSLHPLQDHVSIEKGANFSAMVKLGEEKGYFLLCHTGNCIFVKNEYSKFFPEVITKDPNGNTVFIDTIVNVNQYFNTAWYSGTLQPVAPPPVENTLLSVQSRQMDQQHQHNQMQQFLKDILSSTKILDGKAIWETSADKISELQKLVSNPL